MHIMGRVTRRMFHEFDIGGFIAFLCSYGLWNLSVNTTANPLYIPPNDANVNFPLADSQQIGRNTLEYIVYFGFVALIVLFRALALFFPSQLKSFCLCSCVWSELIAVCLANATAAFLKGYVGRPRPDTYQVCGYNTTATTCKASEKKALKQFLSWPSNHGACSMSGGTFMTLFVQSLHINHSSLFDVASLIFMIFGIYVGATRIKDFKHSTDDVCAGLFVGFVFGACMWKGSENRIYDEFKNEGPEHAQLLEADDDLQIEMSDDEL